MSSPIDQRLAAWQLPEAVGRTPSFGEIQIESADYRTLCLTLPFEEGQLRLRFNEVRSFMTKWDSDRNPYLTFDEAVARTSDIMKVEGSRWLAESFSLDIDSGPASDKPWEHFWIVANERSIHIAAKDDVDTQWIGGTWSGGPGAWKFTPAG